MHPVFRLAAAAALVLAGSAALAAKVRSIPQTTPDAGQVSAFALPKPSGLTAPFPAGISGGSGAAVSSDRVAADSAPIPVNTAVNRATRGTRVNDSGNNPFTGDTTTPAEATSVLGAGGVGFPGPSQNVNAGAGGYSATDLARWFYFADANHDGELTPAEYARLPVKPLGFEQMDRNFDGIISRFEYDDAFR